MTGGAATRLVNGANPLTRLVVDRRSWVASRFVKACHTMRQSPVPGYRV